MSDLDKFIATQVDSCKSTSFYGDLILSFRAGVLTLVRKAETILPPPTSNKEKPKEADHARQERKSR